MNIENRRQKLVNYLKHEGKTSVNDLANIFETSGATIRTDLRTLEEEGLVVRRYGSAEACGASKIGQASIEDRSMDEKQTLNLDLKSAIAKKACELIRDGDSIILDCGSTTLQMVPHLEDKLALTLMTNSMHIVNAMAQLEREHTVIIPGGTYRRISASFHGKLAEQAFSQFTFDKLFIGADGFDLNSGTTTYNEAYQVSQAMYEAANEVIVVLDSNKFGRRSPNVVVPLKDIDAVITDSNISPEHLAELESDNIKVYLV
ncbi:glucitol operon DNA-binding transcriptional repressor SrlR [Vibrio mediterranei]|uniref:Transcriptional regulator n=1 Tax=Vibrio mediterranei TaxID=689 RepID=A0AAN1KRC7_9VIBR|nr:DNA-binding transcriptional repressor [Vibrio mediterranei]ASI93374.1 transcriptional regulator [Vibrio mediterranei]